MKKQILKLLSVLGLLISSNMNAQIGLSFNGTNNYVSTTSAPVLNNGSRTVDAWIKTTSTITTQLVLCDWGNLTPNGSRFTLNILTSKLRIEVAGAGLTGTTNINTGQWFHVTAVYNSTITSGPNVFLYLNGALEAQGNFTGYSTLTTASTFGFRMGSRIDNVNYFNGAMDEVKVYNYARSQAQVAADTIEFCTPQPGLVAYYKLNEGVANATNTGSNVATDYSGNANNGTLNSFTLSGTSSNWVPGRVGNGTPTISASPSANLCTGGTVTLSANAIGTYTWSNGNSTTNSISVSPTITTSYGIINTTPYGCITGAIITVTVSTSAPILTVTTTQNPICQGAPTSFSVNGAVTYTFTGGINNNQNFTPSVTTSYTITGGNTCGTVSTVQTITVVPLPVTAVANPSSACEGYTTNLTATAVATSYTWLPGPISGSNILIVTPTISTIYTISVSDGTCVGSQTLQLVSKPVPTISINNTLITMCEGETATLVVTGAGANGTYSWSPGGNTNSTYTVSPNSNTNYSVIGTDAQGCSGIAQIPVVILASPPLNATASKILICDGETVTVTANGASTYTWSFGSYLQTTTVTPGSGFSVISVTATANTNSCTTTKTIGIAAITPSVVYTSTATICSGNSATLSASGANTYSWNNISVGVSGQTVVIPATSTNYTLTANTQSLSTNCLSTYITTVTVNAKPTLTVVVGNTNTICKGLSNTITASGANTYSWSGSTSTASSIVVSPSVTTNYTVIGTDNNGCEATNTSQVKISACLGVSEQSVDSHFAVYPNPSTGEIQISTELDMKLELIGLNGQFIRTIQLSSGVTKVDLSDIDAGIYLLKSNETATFSPKKIIIQH